MLILIEQVSLRSTNNSKEVTVHVGDAMFELSCLLAKKKKAVGCAPDSTGGSAGHHLCRYMGTIADHCRVEKPHVGTHTIFPEGILPAVC